MGKNIVTPTREKVTKVSDLSVEDLKGLIKETVQETLDEILGDPDEGLELREEFVTRFKHSLQSHEEMIPLAEVAAQNHRPADKR